MKKTAIKDKIEGNELDLSMNGLTEVPVQELANAPKATHLDLSCNEIHSLPNTFITLTHLVKIDLSKNFLTELPQNFGKLSNLEYLDLYGNQLTTLPVSFCRLKRLRWLDLKNNSLTQTLKTVAGDCLDQKQCQACAKNIVAYMQSVESELERQKQKRLKEERAREAAKLAKEQEELAEQRRIKKAEREKRKAEKKEKMTSQPKHNSENDTLKNGQRTIINESKKTTSSRPGSWCKFCLIFTLMIPLILVMCIFGVHVMQGHDIQLASSSLLESYLEFQSATQIWWNTFVLPHLSRYQDEIQNWLKSVGFL